MILRLIHPGSAGSGNLSAAGDEYRARIRQLRTEECFIKAKKRPEAGIERALADEGSRILAKVGPRDILIALDIGGKSMSSSGHVAVCFALGSAYGLHPSVKEKAQACWSFGKITLPHDLARIVLWEQLYRAGTILKGEPYHKA
jgi:23S rRNA (pseudouridine1915-N3)-methyltransferase